MTVYNRSSRQQCQREGCTFLAAQKRTYCSFMCRAINEDLDRTRRMCEVLGTDSPVVAEMWAEIVDCADAWTRYKQLDRKVFDLAVSVGYTREQWMAVKDGRT